MRALLLVLLAVGCSEQDYAVQAHDRPPEAEITSPAVDAELLMGTTDALFEAVVSDDKDLARALQTEWVLDDVPVPGGEVGEGGVVTAEVDLSGLLRGEHLMELNVTDTAGHGNTAVLRFWIVGAPGAPEVLITSPEDGTASSPGEEITFRGEATDTATAPGDLLFTWTSDLDGELVGALSADGSSVLFYDALSEGVHLITLSAEDEDGEIGEDSVIVDVSAEPVVSAEPGDLVISEMMINPQAVPDEVGEWVELYNTAGYAIDVTGYTFRDDDSDRWVLEGPFLVPPHGYFVLCASTDTSENGGVPCDGWFHRSIYGDGMALANNPDEIVLARPDGLEIGRLNYTDAWFTPAVAVGVNPEVLGTDGVFDLANWCDQTTITPPMVEPGTPGQPNDSCTL